ncbi:syntenin-1-like [Onthophagus taurus]|uniref:syntenin-1-like n=1 Tax=Onthophagus taurus TaxID=166361 RepID=UPI0039BE4C68
MSLYPSLEDMQMDQMVKAQEKVISQSYANQYPTYQQQTSADNPPAYSPAPIKNEGTVYPALGDFMGLELSEAVIAANMPEYSQIAIIQQAQIVPSGYSSQMIAPLSSQTLGLQKAQVTHGIRELILCKDKHNKVGMRVKAIDNGVFVCLVIKDSPAALVGLRFGDQILQINGKSVAGYSMDKVHDLFKKSPVNGISIVVRDRPFERTITLHKDSTNHIGFHFKNGKINNLVKDSSAAKNGLLTNHQLLEVDGQNVVGLKDKEVVKIIDDCGPVVTVTVIPSYIYDHMVKKMSGSLIKDLMDHSIPAI